MSDNEYSEVKEFLFRNFLETTEAEHVLVERIKDYVYNSAIDDKEEEFQELVGEVFELYNTGFNRFIDLAYLLNIPAVFAETKQLGVWYMKNIQKRTNAEIASLMKVTESTVRDQYRLAEKQLEREAERIKIYEKHVQKAEKEKKKTKDDLVFQLIERLNSLREEALQNETWERLRDEGDDEEEVYQMFGNYTSLQYQDYDKLAYWATEATDEEIKEIIIKAKKACDKEGEE